MEDKSAIDASKNESNDDCGKVKEQMNVKKDDIASNDTEDTLKNNKVEHSAVQSNTDTTESGAEQIKDASQETDSGKATGSMPQTQSEANSDSEMKGWLQKRTKGMLGMSCKWERQWFHLKGTDLFYGENQQVLCAVFNVILVNKEYLYTMLKLALRIQHAVL